MSYNYKDDLPAVAVPVPFAPSAPSAPGRKNASYPSFNRASEVSQQQTSDLKKQGFTQGLIDVISSSTNYFPLRIWVVDNSGSMNKSDGQRLVTASNKNFKIRLVSCTRWAELQETIEYHVQMAALIHAPTTFRLLNNPGAHIGPQEFTVGEDLSTLDKDVDVARRTMQRASPSGVTPLTSHIVQIRDYVAAIMDDLNAEGKKITIVLATDGLPTNESGIGGDYETNLFTNALRSLEGLPVWIVIRLCTDEEDVVEFYNNLDAQLELSIEVLDDLTGEAKEVTEHNPWLNYTLQLHRMREMGIPHRLFDLLDERKFTRSEVREFCILLFGAGKVDGLTDPEVDWVSFLKDLKGILAQEKEQWDPVRQKMKPILDLKEMNRIYGDSACSIM